MGNGAALDNGARVLATIGRLAVRWSRPLVGSPKTVTISREADGWYAGFSCAAVPTQPLPLTGRATGIEVGRQVWLVTAAGAAGAAVAHPRHHRRAEKRLAQAQRRVARRKQGSKRRDNAQRLLAKQHQQVQRQRCDFPHQTALSLLRAADVLSRDDLRVAHLVRNRHLATSISDAGGAQLRTLLSCKAAWAGKRVVVVEPASPSHDCRGCGARVEKRLSVRTPVCRSCGRVLDRDQNAARNSLWAGQARQGAGAVAAALN